MEHVAQVEGHTPEVWLLDDRHLTTWGGTDYNRLLAWILAARFGLTKPVSDERRIRVDRSLPPLSDLLKEAHRLDPSSFDVELARGFGRPTPFTSRLSSRLRQIENAAAIPWPGFLGWLSGVRSIRRASCLAASKGCDWTSYRGSSSNAR